MYKFIRKNGGYDEDVKHKVELRYATWADLIEEFQQFLEKCGYVFAEGFDMSNTLWVAHEAAFKKEQQDRERNK